MTSENQNQSDGQRTAGGRFVPGNRGGPGRPRREAEAVRLFLKQVAGIVPAPERFTVRQRETFIKLLGAFLESPDTKVVTAAASVLLALEATNPIPGAGEEWK